MYVIAILHIDCVLLALFSCCNQSFNEIDLIDHSGETFNFECSFQMSAFYFLGGCLMMRSLIQKTGGLLLKKKKEWSRKCKFRDFCTLHCKKLI